MKKQILKENIVQVILIIVSILTAFGIDRGYESYKIEKRKQQFYQDQVIQLDSENQRLTKSLHHAIDLRNKAGKGLNYTHNVDSLIEYTQWMGALNYFNPEISSLNELMEVYNLNNQLPYELKRAFQSMYWRYGNVEFYENDYNLDIYNHYKPFWRKHYNSFNNTYPDKEEFVSNEYLNIIQNFVVILESRIEAYSAAKKSQEELIAQIDALKK